ncbi:MAG: hypothetical protein JNK87_09755 [Bryobacterales bacterium]|nr:hypothetical protein [Bryobacterales bacterium]
MWRRPDGNLLVETSLKPIPYLFGGVGLPDGERYDDAGTYVEFTPSGEFVRSWSAPIPFPIDDYMTVSNIFRVIGDTLYHFSWQQARDEPPDLIVIDQPGASVHPAPVAGLVVWEGAVGFDLDAALARLPG